jgi:hypothetical protein
MLFVHFDESAFFWVNSLLMDSVAVKSRRPVAFSSCQTSMRNAPMQ